MLAGYASPFVVLGQPSERTKSFRANGYIYDNPRELGRREAEPKVHAPFYPFSTLRYNIGQRGHRRMARAGEILLEAP